MIRVLIIEDHDLVRDGMRMLLNETKGMQVVGEAKTGQEGLALAREKKPDVVILDFRLPDTTGLQIAQKILRRLPDVKVLVVTAMKSEILPLRLLKLGIHGYLTKDSGGAELVRAIRLIHSGQRHLSSDIANRLALQKATNDGKAPFSELSERELEVMLMLAKGMNTQAIAEQLCISSKTVNSYRYRMFEKLKVKNDIGLLKLAIQNGLVEIDALE